eukprot:snap_masked-scaffold_36-processed-gene-1.38-mRNA-1 protein AED:1.00 eAED:1.00 QI:0/0/0/0/1/1/2/0/120
MKVNKIFERLYRYFEKSSEGVSVVDKLQENEYEMEKASVVQDSIKQENIRKAKVILLKHREKKVFTTDSFTIDPDFSSLTVLNENKKRHHYSIPKEIPAFETRKKLKYIEEHQVEIFDNE